MLPLVDPLRAAADRVHADGIPVVFYPAWDTREADRNGRGFTPVGILNHHTAPPVPYPLSKLTLKCNVSVRWPDGALCLLNSGYAYDSGLGDPAVLDRVRRDQPVGEPADLSDRGRILGNPWFVDVEVQHPGDGSPLPDVMRRSLVLFNAAVCDWFGWDPATRLLGHREWTRRKVDPRWDGTANPMPTIRADTADAMEDTMTEAQYRTIIQVLDHTRDESVASRRMLSELLTDRIAAHRATVGLPPDPTSDGYHVRLIASGERTLAEALTLITEAAHR